MTAGTILAFDTSGPYCAACLLIDDAPPLAFLERMQRGQAEALFPLLEAVLDHAKANWQDVSAIGVGTGPGNFTGIRIAVSAARGLSLGLKVPAIGVSAFDMASAGKACPVYIPAPRDQAYVQQPGAAPELVSMESALAVADICGPSAPEDGVQAIAHLARKRLKSAQADPIAPPTPLYIRSADAAPSRDAPPVILDDA